MHDFLTMLAAIIVAQSTAIFILSACLFYALMQLEEARQKKLEMVVRNDSKADIKIIPIDEGRNRTTNEPV